MNAFNLERAFQQKREKGYSKIFVAVDLHDCCIKGTYTLRNEGRTLYPGAEEVLRYWSQREDIVLILWTSSYEQSAREMMEWMESHGILFDYLNENPECPTTDLCDFSAKFYFNILLDDKSGFEGDRDWALIKAELIRIGEWKNI